MRGEAPARRFSWRTVTALTEPTADELGLADRALAGLAQRGAAPASTFELVKPWPGVERVVISRLSLDAWVCVITRMPAKSVVLVARTDDVWMQQLRELVRGAQDAEHRMGLDVAHDAIELLEVEVLQEARLNAARAGALVALLQVDSVDAGGELEKLHDQIFEPRSAVVKALDDAIARRRRSS